MGKIIAVCGKICCGKSYYSNNLKLKENAVILSCDEVTNDLFNNNLGEKHDEITKKIKSYLLKKAVEIASTNSNVILDWGFWSKEERQNINNYFKSKNTQYEWHYINIDDISWNKNIEERNNKITNGLGNDFYLDDDLIQKLLSIWQEPTKAEINVWIDLKR